MWRRRPLSGVPARISSTLTRRRALRLAVLGMIGALTLLWLHGSLPASVSATSAATSPGVVQNVEAHLTTAATQLKVSPKVATTPGDVLAGIVEVRRTSGLDDGHERDRQRRRFLGASGIGAQPQPG